MGSYRRQQIQIYSHRRSSLRKPQRSGGDMPLTKEELEQLGGMVSEAVATNTEKRSSLSQKR